MVVNADAAMEKRHRLSGRGPSRRLGFFASGIFSGMGAFLTENFPTRMRGPGQGFAYNFGRGIGALNPTFVGLLSTALPLGQSIGVFAGIAYGIVVIMALLLPETRGRELTPD
jgi:MFS family permease